MLKSLIFMALGALALEAAEARELNNFVDNIYISSLEFDKLVMENKEESRMIFYVNDSFDNHRADYNDFNTYSIINSKLHDNLTLMVYYNFVYDNLKYCGEIYANSYIGKENIENKIAEIKATIYDGTYLNNRINNQSIVVDSNWKLLESKKMYKICNYKKEHYADLEEWRSIYKLSCANKNYNYYALITESIIKPEEDKTDYRTDGIEYKITAPKDDVDFFNDGPRFKNDNDSIDYTVHAGAGVIDNNNSMITSEINISYPTLVDSPFVDRRPVARNQYQLYLDYAHPYDDSGKYYKYNISQSYQCMALVMITDAKLNRIELQDERSLEIQRDGFWSNSLGKFAISSNIIMFFSR